MQRMFVWMALGEVAACCLASVPARPQQALETRPAVRSSVPAGDVPAMPPPPSGKSTIMGGVIANIDTVRDRMSLDVFGERPIRILFDERTQVYRDGNRIHLQDLHLKEHASVQTILDGSDVFALSIHILSQSPGGEYQGRVLNYRPESGELTIEGGVAGEPIKLQVSANTSIARQGQSTFSSRQSGLSDLVSGALVSVEFRTGSEGRGVANHVTVLATPGSNFVFTGDVTFLDMHSGLIVLADSRDNQSFQIFFNPERFAPSSYLHSGQHVRIVAHYDGTHYVASEIAAN